MSFVDRSRLLAGGPAAFGRAIERLLLHLGFRDVFNVDGKNDGGADIVARKGEKYYVFQCKWKKNGSLSSDVLERTLDARYDYHADGAFVVTNASLTEPFLKQVGRIKDRGEQFYAWGGEELSRLYERSTNRLPAMRLRPYQVLALNAVSSDLKKKGTALLYLATGLGKTVVTGEIVAETLKANPNARVLVLAHVKELVAQLERALWIHLDKSTPTQLVTGEDRPDELTGVTVGTMQSSLAYIREGQIPDLLVVDEAHHVSSDGVYSEILENTKSAARLGVTATPWRGDGYDIERVFGPPGYALGIEDGLRLGYLAPVEYKMFCDNIDWDQVEHASKQGYSVRQLNSKLFLPQRDEIVIEELLAAWHSTRCPKVIVFCRNIDHATYLLSAIRDVPGWQESKCLHMGVPKWDRKRTLLDFRRGACPILVAVDILNEGVDVPDVNIICFARVTHSRRIFVQQLGRGLRISEGKKSVKVLDFVSDVRRVAEVLDLDGQPQAGHPEILRLDNNQFSFSDERAGTFFQEWLKDVADLKSSNEEHRLNFPDITF